jgi:putative membrane protein insertion efficiency factor
MNIVQQALIFLIRVYQAALSPMLAAVLGPSARCRFTPSCSQYAREAVSLHGAILGGWLALRRLGRCHPWGDCGADPPPAGPLKLKLPRWKPKSLTSCLWTHPRGGPVSVEAFRRRENRTNYWADGGGRDDRAPEEVATDWGLKRRKSGICHGS